MDSPSQTYMKWPLNEKPGCSVSRVVSKVGYAENYAINLTFYMKLAKTMIFEFFKGRGVALGGGCGSGRSGQTHLHVKFEHNNIFHD